MHGVSAEAISEVGCIHPNLILHFDRGAVNTVSLITSPMAKSVWRSVVALSAPVDVYLISIAETVAEEEVLYS
jgi:hypothetical protein